MSDLTSFEKMKLERLFEMGSGYVLDFLNRTFSEFILENAGVEIYDDRYSYTTGSKANRLRAFWQKEPNHVVGRLLANLLKYWKVKKETYYSEITPEEQTLYEECLRIAERLKQDGPLEDIDAIRPITDDRDFSLLTKSIRQHIHDNEPEVALDRLHTYVVKYVRQLCDKHGISYEREMPLHGLFGRYVKYLRQNNLIETPMTERILKVSISLLEEFNNVRNRRSFAHDNPLLNYSESILICNSVASTIKFLQSLEGDDMAQPGTDQPDQDQDGWDSIPF